MTDTTRTSTCSEHGVFEARHLFGGRYSTCPTCQEEAEAERKRQEQAARRQQAIREWTNTSGLTGRYRDCSFENFRIASPAHRRVHAACLAFADALRTNQGHGLFLIGPPGTGKSHLGSALVKRAIEQLLVSAQMHSARDIIRMLRATWGKAAQGRAWDGMAVTEEHVLEDLIGVGLLVIDEVGVSFGSESEQIQLFDVIDGRYTMQRPTVLLSNLGLPQLKPALGDRAYDRLREGVQVLLLDWPSYRGRQA